MKKKTIISIVVVFLVILLAGVWFYPSDNSKVTGKVVSTEKPVETESETEVEEEIEEEEEKEINDGLEDIHGDDLIKECLLTCGAESKTGLEADVWKTICNKKYDQSEEKLRDFIRTC